MWGANRHGERGITVMKAWVVILTLRVKLTLSLAAGRFLLRRVAGVFFPSGRCLVSVTKRLE